MLPQEKAAILEELGLSDFPTPRLEVPEAHPLPVKGYMTYQKCLTCVDPLATAAFEKYIPASCHIDQGLSARDFHPYWTKGVSIRTDIPAPSDPRIARLTGVPAVADERAWYPWLAIELKKLYDGYGARAVSPPLIWRTNGHEGTVPLIGLIAKFDLTPKDGQTIEDQTASMAVLAPLEG